MKRSNSCSLYIVNEGMIMGRAHRPKQIGFVMQAGTLRGRACSSCPLVGGTRSLVSRQPYMYNSMYLARKALSCHPYHMATSENFKSRKSVVTAKPNWDPAQNFINSNDRALQKGPSRIMPHEKPPQPSHCSGMRGTKLMAIKYQVVFT